MQSPHPPRPPYPPHRGAPPGESDRGLVARLRDPDGGHHAVALLLARHWRATYDYAVICLAATGGSAAMVATAAFGQVMRRQTGGAVGGALRPQLLAAARETVRTWAADEAACVVLPELRRPAGGRGLRAVRSVTPERRQLAERAFHALPGAFQCLLWHTEVEAEPISIPAGLLAVDADTAAGALHQAREQFRAGCVRAHRELATSRECRFYNRLLGVPMSRGVALLPDVRRHLRECSHCRHAAEQLGHFGGGLDVLLAETVLGWGARRYLDSRPARAASPSAPSASDPARAPGGGRHRTPSAGQDTPSRRHWKALALALGIGLASLALLATVLVVRAWTNTGAVPGPRTAWGAPGGNAVRPSAAAVPSGNPSAASASRPAEVAHGRLRAPAAGLRLDVRGGRVAAGAGAGLAACSVAGPQQWSYRDDGLLRSAADPALRPEADRGRWTVLVSGCAVRTGEVSHDLTVPGELLLSRGRGLVVVPGSGTSRTRVVVEARDGSGVQRRLLDPLTPLTPLTRRARPIGRPAVPDTGGARAERTARSGWPGWAPWSERSTGSERPERRTWRAGASPSSRAGGAGTPRRAAARPGNGARSISSGRAATAATPRSATRDPRSRCREVGEVREVEVGEVRGVLGVGEVSEVR
ncbi:hydrolase [Streptomyces sp. NPDC020801]|uniref:hydrolase n=1 Tax=unclassified Streptomyces TaxID=2593676 RepID=UPI0037AB2D69